MPKDDINETYRADRQLPKVPREQIKKDLDRLVRGDLENFKRYLLITRGLDETSAAYEQYLEMWYECQRTQRE